MSRSLVAMFIVILAALGTATTQGPKPASDYEKLRARLATFEDDAPAELHWNLALAALAEGKLVEAEIAAEKAAVYGGPAFERRRDFLFGNADYRRCERAEVLSQRPEAGAPELDAAIEHARAALAHWMDAARPDDDLAARRNAQRVLEKMAILEAKLDFMREQAKKNPKREEKRPPEEKRPEQRERRLLSAVTGELSPAQVKRLMERLEEKRREKLALRRRRLLERSVEGGRDL